MRTESENLGRDLPVLLPAAYVAAVDEIAQLLDRAKARIARSEGRDDHAILDQVFHWTLPRWRGLVARAASLARPLRPDTAMFDEAKRRTQASLLPLLSEGPIWRRSFEKPRGYPGDYGILNFVYDRSDQGLGVYARLCHRLGLDVGNCVRTRMDLVVAELLSRLHASGGEMRSLSIGCGSAREVPTALLPGVPARCARFFLLDQDPEALASARGFVEPVIAPFAAGAVSVEYLNVDYRKIFREPDALRLWGDQDLVYCIGLLDYLPQEQLEPFVKRLFCLVKPAGLLILGNMKEPTDTFWPLEFILDWNLIYRTEAQMRQIARLPGVQRSELLLEETGNNFMLKLWKAA